MTKEATKEAKAKDKEQTKTIKDAHGNAAEVPTHVGTGPDHMKEKHPNGVNTGRKDAHGNEIWETTKSEKDDE
jgi:hypothetical protein